VNGVDAGMDSAGFTAQSLANGAVVRCVLTSNLSCVTSPTAVSNTLPIVVSPVVEAGVTIAVPETTICAGTPVSFTASPSNGGTAPAYRWLVNGVDAGADSVQFTTSALVNGDVVSCIMTSSLTCSSSAGSGNSITMVVNPLPVIALFADTMIATGGSIVLNAVVSIDAGGSVVSYQWTPATGLSDAAVVDPVAQPATTTTYQLTVASNMGCVAVGKVAVGVFGALAMPNAFTPNGGGKNDVFRIPPSINVKIISFAVYNRWGAQMFMTSNAGVGWDGTVAGSKQPTGAYVWEIEYEDFLTGKPVRIHGTVMLIR
jgi:gliding motility-associated-like protein